MIYILDLRESHSAGLAAPGLLMNANRVVNGALENLQYEDHIVFLSHGTNMSRPAGLDALLRLAQILASSGNMGLVVTLWPSDHSDFSPWRPEYRYADDAAFYLSRFIGDNLSLDSRLSFVSHGLGARMIMGTVNKIVEQGFRVEEVCLLAADIDDDSLADVRLYRKGVERTKRVSVLSSKQDRLLEWFYPLSSLLRRSVFSRRFSGAALGYGGPEPEREWGQSVPANVYHAPIPAERNASHGDYLPGRRWTFTQKSTAAFVQSVLSGELNPRFR